MTAAATSPYEPAAHAVHADAPGRALYRLVAHAVQPLAVVIAVYNPAKHVAHAAVLPALNFPGVHVVHADAPESVL